MTNPTPDRHTCHDRTAAAGPAWQCPRCSGLPAPVPSVDRAAVLREVLPVWEAVYEPGNVSDYLIGYANDQDAATGMAEAWMRSQAEVTGRLEWVDEEQMATGRYDRWFELVERHDGGVDTGTGIIVRRRMTAETQPVDDPCARCDHGRTAHNISGCTECPAGWRSDHQFQPAAEAQPATPDTETPRRGDPFEAWLKQQRDASTTWSDRHALDAALDRYRLHADTRTPLGEHVCEGKVAGDCECLEPYITPSGNVRVDHILRPAEPVQPAGSAAAPAKDTPTDTEHCVHDRAVHTRHHHQPIPGCPWCAAKEQP